MATLSNDKLPSSDKPRVEGAIVRYRKWIKDIEGIDGVPNEILNGMVAALNDYRNYIDVDLIFNSPNDFLYRQKGQLKLDNSVIEEFLPRLIGHPLLIPELASTRARLGPTQSFSSAYFDSALDNPLPGGGLSIKTKNQDFAIAKPIYISASHHDDFSDATNQQTFISYVAAECKMNLDKTMFQEACATAHDLKSATVGARYYLLCEWLDMSPQSTVATDIDEIIILRKAKRQNSNIRKNYDLAEKRQRSGDEYLKFLETNPFRVDMFDRFVNHVRKLFKAEQIPESSVLQRGYF